MLDYSQTAESDFATASRRTTDRRAAAGRAQSHFSNHEGRDARPVRCNGWSGVGRIAADERMSALRTPRVQNFDCQPEALVPE